MVFFAKVVVIVDLKTLEVQARSKVEITGGAEQIGLVKTHPPSKCRRQLTNRSKGMHKFMSDRY